MTKIAVFVGSLRRDSLNKALAKNLEALAPEDTEFTHVDINLPLYNQDNEAAYPAEAQVMKDILKASDGILFVTPEYNRGIPGVLKNAIDWASRPYGDGGFDNKPTGIVGASSGPIGTAAAQQQLRSVLLYLNTHPLGQPEVYLNGSTAFDENGQVVEASREFLQHYIATFVAHVEKFKLS